MKKKLNNYCKRIPVFHYIIMGVFLLFALIIFLNGNSQSNDIRCIIYLQPDSAIYVDDNNINGPWTGTLLHPFQNIPEGLTASSPGVTVVVMPGKYPINQNISVPDSVKLFLFHGDTLQFGQNCCLEIAGRIQANGYVADSIYFTSSANGNTWAGIRFINSDPGSVMQYCKIENSIGYDGIKGGGIYIFNSELQLKDSRIYFNSADFGGGIYCDNNSRISIVDCQIDNNIANISGGGIYSVQADSLIIKNCQIINNCSQNNGGGINVKQSVYSITYNTVKNNSADNGGGIYIDNILSPFSDLSWNTIELNIASSLGSGIYIYHTNSIVIDRNLLIQNYSYFSSTVYLNNSGIWFLNNNVFKNNAFTFNGGITSSGINSNNKFYNNIIWENNSPNMTQIAGSGFYAEFNTISGGYPGNNFSAYPMFVDTALNNFHLHYGSPCINTGATFTVKDPDSSVADIGVFYYHNKFPQIRVYPDSLYSFFTEYLDTINSSLKIVNTGSDQLYWEIDSVNKPNQCLTFDGISNYVNCGNDLELNLMAKFTLEAMIYPESWGENGTYGYGRIIDKTKFSIYLHDYEYASYNDHCLVFSPYIGGTNYPVFTGNNSISLYKWQHIAVTYDGENTSIYINGKKQQLFYSSSPPSGSLDDNTLYDLLIGESVNQNRAFKGKIDEIRIWNDCIDYNTIYNWKNKQVTVEHPYWPDLKAYYLMDENNDSLIDISGNKNNGINYGCSRKSSDFNQQSCYDAIITTQPGAGQINLVDTSNIGITFHSKMLLPEIHYFDINIQCNDPLNQIVSVDAIIEVDTIQHDVGVKCIPMDTLFFNDTIIPSVIVTNYGSQSESFTVTLSVSPNYNSVKYISNLLKSQSQLIHFDPWIPNYGKYSLVAKTELLSDIFSYNNTKELVVWAMNKLVYGYCASSGVGTVPKGPVSFSLANPEIITSIANQSTLNFIRGGTWANGQWYGIEATTGKLLTIDPISGIRNYIGNSVDLNGLSYDYVSDILYGLTNNSLYKINPLTGSAILVGTCGAQTLINLACNLDGELFSVDIGTDMFGIIDKTTGSFSPIGNIGFDASYAQDMEFDRKSGYCFMAAYNNSVPQGELRLVNTTNGTSSLIGIFQGGADITGFAIPYDEYKIYLTANLEGAYDPSTLEMRTDLPQLPDNEFPSSQPYFITPWNYGGNESITNLPENVVDWILVEIRETSGGASTATSSTKIWEQAAFLLSDGRIIASNGNDYLFFDFTSFNNLYCVLWHRNHLGILSSLPLSKTGLVYFYDFTTGSDKVYGGSLGYKELGPGYGIWGMVAGDGNADGNIGEIDKTNNWRVLAGQRGYKSGDFNLNGQVNNPDKNNYWLPNIGKSCQVPD